MKESLLERDTLGADSTIVTKFLSQDCCSCCKYLRMKCETFKISCFLNLFNIIKERYIKRFRSNHLLKPHLCLGIKLSELSICFVLGINFVLFRPFTSKKTTKFRILVIFRPSTCSFTLRGQNVSK